MDVVFGLDCGEKVASSTPKVGTGPGPGPALRGEYIETRRAGNGGFGNNGMRHAVGGSVKRDMGSARLPRVDHDLPPNGQRHRSQSPNRAGVPPHRQQSPPRVLVLDAFGPGARESPQQESSKAQQIYEDKKARREQRRSLKENGDFLGVQGANPRTGYWDPSVATSSTDPSQLSEQTKKKLDQQARDLAQQTRRYEEAKERHHTELKRVETIKAKKKQDKLDRKRREIKLRQRSKGKWKVSDVGWSSVVEPELSPITQSLVGSPNGGVFLYFFDILVP